MGRALGWLGGGAGGSAKVEVVRVEGVTWLVLRFEALLLSLRSPAWGGLVGRCGASVWGGAGLGRWSVGCTWVCVGGVSSGLVGGWWVEGAPVGGVGLGFSELSTHCWVRVVVFLGSSLAEVGQGKF